MQHCFHKFSAKRVNVTLIISYISVAYVFSYSPKRKFFQHSSRNISIYKFLYKITYSTYIEKYTQNFTENTRLIRNFVNHINK